VTEIETIGEWQFAEFPIRYYVGVTKKKDKRGKSVTYAGGIIEIVNACAAIGNPLTDTERKAIPTDPQKLANLLAKKVGRKSFDLVIFNETYKSTDEEGNEVMKTSTKGKIVKTQAGIVGNEAPATAPKVASAPYSGDNNFLSDI
jgi:hypothetical protein